MGAVVALPWWLGAALSTPTQRSGNFSFCLLEEIKYLTHRVCFFAWCFFFFFESCFVDELSQDIPYLSEGTFLSRKPLTSFSECFVRDKLHQALNADDTRREKKNETSLFEVCRWILSFNGSRTPGASATAAGARCLLRAGWQCCPNFAVHSQCACAEVGGGGR